MFALALAGRAEADDALAAGILLLASRVDGRPLLREVVRARPAAEGLAVVLVAQGRPLVR
jgi:hypothetical protein